MISLSGLNSPQREAAETIDGPVLILAGAGSGKTRTITYRMAHMIDNLGINPTTILAVSFTNKAAKEMRERMETLLSRKKLKGITLCTFHSLGVRILKQEIDKLGYQRGFNIYDTSDQIGIIRQAMKLFNSDKAEFDRKRILSKIGYLKNKGITSDEFANSEYFDDENPYDHATLFCYEFYQEKLKFYNAIDFDDILFLTSRLFKEHPDVAIKYSEKYKYIMVDEYQDTNPLQFSFIEALTTTHKNLCVVGDDDQSIYSFRGADISNILGFEKKFIDAKVIKLEQNYRSISSILDLANVVIKENTHRKDKTLWSSKKSDEVPQLWACGDSVHEAQIIADEVAKIQVKGIHLGEVAILYRSNTQTDELEEELKLSNVPYVIFGGQKLYDKKEVKDLIAYLCVIHNTKDEMNLRRILNVPARKIGNATLEKYLALSTENKQSLYDNLLKNPSLDPKRTESITSFVKLIEHYRNVFAATSLPEALGQLIEEIKYLDFIDKEHDNPKQSERRKNDIHRFIESSARFVKYHTSEHALSEFVERLLLQDSQDREDQNEEDDDVRPNQVNLMTLHASKGLEFDYVFLMGMEEETLPHKKTITEGGDINEERRLAYVGITRAREKLVMTYAKQRKIYGKMVPRSPSRFVNELNKNPAKTFYTSQDRTTFGHMTEVEAHEYKKSFFENLMKGLD